MTCRVCGAIVSGVRPKRCAECTREFKRKRQRELYAVNASGIRERKAEYRASHPELFRQADRRWREQNIEKARAKCRQYNQARRRQAPEATAARRREYARGRYQQRVSLGWRREQKHTPRVELRDRLNQLRRRSALTGAETQKIRPEAWEAHVDAFGGVCAYCAGTHEHIDHITPVRQRGPHRLENLAPACSICNLAKWARSAVQWRPETAAYVRWVAVNAATPGPARNAETIAARIRQLGLLGVPYPAKAGE